MGELWSHALEDLSYDLVIGPLKDPVRVTEKVASTQLVFTTLNGQLQTEGAGKKHASLCITALFGNSSAWGQFKHH